MVVAEQRARKAGKCVTAENFASMIDPKRGYALGRLYIDEQISREQHDAGIWALSRDFAYLRFVLNSWPYPRNLVLEQMPEITATADESAPAPVSTEDRAKRVTAAYMLVEGAITSAGAEAKAEFRHVVYADGKCTELGALKRALDSVRKEAGL